MAFESASIHHVHHPFYGDKHEDAEEWEAVNNQLAGESFNLDMNQFYRWLLQKRP
jgi:fatty acid desaturase